MTAIEWSPLGLGKHKSSVLAVLTSDNVLSIWECSGRPEVKGDWRRALIVNHSLGSISSKPASDEPNIRSRRVRAFCWAPMQFRMGHLPHKSDHYLAVADDNGTVAILRVRSPYDILATDQSTWHASLGCSFRATTSAIGENLRISYLTSTQSQRPQFVDQMSWSPWTFGQDGVLFSILAFTTSTRLHTTRIRYLPNQPTVRLDVEAPTRTSIPGMPDMVTGPIRWAPTPTSSDPNMLVFLDNHALWCLRVSAVTGVQLSHQVFDTQWDRVSGT